ncbi:MAG TPA: zinc ribbon domain-containing protein [Bryobacterales bacterium]|nr:zinc ribbon domain-containing protein [Bryobacterales bacterium]
MPIFEYRCSSCHQQFEELVLSRKNRSRVECPHCGGTKVTPLISRFATQASSSDGDCYNRSAGVCEAGGGAMT